MGARALTETEKQESKNHASERTEAPANNVREIDALDMLISDSGQIWSKHENKNASAKMEEKNELPKLSIDGLGDKK